MKHIIPQLPIEMINKILYAHNGLEHPISQSIKKYFNDLDDNYSIFKHIQKQIEEWVIEDGTDQIVISRKETFIIQEKEYPRIFFEPQLDIVEEKIISHIINKDE